MHLKPAAKAFHCPFNRAGRPYDVLRLQRSDQRRSVNSQAGEFLHREFDEDPLVLRSQQFDL